MSCPALTNKGGRLYISEEPVDCDLTLSELAVLDYVFVPGVGSIGDTGVSQDVVTYPVYGSGLTPQGKGDAVGLVWEIEVLDAPSQARDILDEASAIGNDDNYATRIEWPNGDVEFSIVQVASRTAVKGASSGVRVVRFSFIPVSSVITNPPGSAFAPESLGHMVPLLYDTTTGELLTDLTRYLPIGATAPEVSYYVDPINGNDGPAKTEDFGLSMPSSQKYNTCVEAPNGKLYFIPFNATNILVYDPAASTGAFETFGLDLSDSGKWDGAVVVPSQGMIYGIPANATDILQLDYVNGTAARSNMGATLTGTAKWRGGVLAGNGHIYGCPYTSTDILDIDLGAGTASRSNFGGDLSGATKWSGWGSADGITFYGAPYTANDVIVFDSSTGTASRTDFGLDLSGAGTWAAFLSAPSGKLYGVPYNSTQVLIVDPSEDDAELSAMGADLTGSSKWFGGGVSLSGKMYTAPFNASDMLEIDDIAGTASRVTLGGYWTGNERWRGFGVTSAGDFYASPWNAANSLVISFSIPNYGKSWDYPFQSVQFAINQNDVDAVYCTPDIYQLETSRTTCITTYSGTRDVHVESVGGRSIFASSRAVTWSAGSEPNTFVSSGTGGTIVRVVDARTADENGMFTALTLVSSAAEVSSTPGSYYFASNSVTVRLSDDSSPTSEILCLRSATTNRISAPGVKFSIQNVDLVGGAGGAFSARGGDANSIVFGIDSTAQHCYNSDGWQIQDIGLSIAVRTWAMGGGNDGFNYHAANGITPQYLEVDCGGIGNRAVGTGNGSTSHEDVIGARFRGKYNDNRGPGIADVDASKSLDVNCQINDNVGSSNSYGIAMYGTAEKWLRNGEAVGNQMGPISAKGNAKLHLLNFDYAGSNIEESVTIDSNFR